MVVLVASTLRRKIQEVLMHQSGHAHFNTEGPALVINELTISEPAVVAEARRWTTGSRGDVAALPRCSRRT